MFLSEFNNSPLGFVNLVPQQSGGKARRRIPSVRLESAWQSRGGCFVLVVLNNNFVLDLIAKALRVVSLP